MSLNKMSRWQNLNFLSNRTGTLRAREDTNAVIAAGCGRTSQERESEVTSLFAEFQAQVSSFRKGKTDMGTNVPELIGV